MTIMIMIIIIVNPLLVKTRWVKNKRYKGS